MQLAAAAERAPPLDQPFVQRIVLVGVAGNDLPLDRLLEPHPLEHGGLEHRRRRVGVVFQELCRALPVIAQVEAAIEAGVAALQARRDPVPEPLRDTKRPQYAFIGDGACHQFLAHPVELGGRRFEVLLDLFQGEGIVGPLVPIAFAVDGMELEADLLGGFAPVGALVAGDALHAGPISRRKNARRRSIRSRRAMRRRCRSATTSPTSRSSRPTNAMTTRRSMRRTTTSGLTSTDRPGIEPRTFRRRAARRNHCAASSHSRRRRRRRRP